MYQNVSDSTRHNGDIARHAPGTAFLGAAVLLSLFTTLAAGVSPREFAGFLGLSVASPGGDNEIRSQYAGFFLAVGALCASSLAGVTPRRTAFTLLAVIFGGLAAGRLVSLGLNGGVAGFGPVIRGLYFVDVPGFLMAAWLLAAERDGAPRAASARTRPDDTVKA